MKVIQFIRHHIWEGMPAEASFKDRAMAAAAWGGALVAIGGFYAWKHTRQGSEIGTASRVLMAAGVALALTLVLPVIGQVAYVWILRVLAIFGFVMSNVMLMLSFYLIVTPMAFVMRLMGKDFLETGRRVRPAWKPYPAREDRKRYYRLF